MKCNRDSRSTKDPQNTAAYCTATCYLFFEAQERHKKRKTVREQERRSQWIMLTAADILPTTRAAHHDDNRISLML